MKKNLQIEGITNELEGASLFFAKKQPLPPPLSSTPSPVPSQPEPRRRELTTKPATKQITKKASNMTSNITILQLFDETDIATLREPAYQAQTFRLREQEIEWVKDTAYRLSKEMRRKKVSQADILRISFKLFERLLATNKADLLSILERIK